MFYDTLAFEASLERLVAVGARSNLQNEGGLEGEVVVKLFLPDAEARWLLSFVEPHDLSIAWGIADLGLDCVEWGAIDLYELDALRGPLGASVAIDNFFVPKMSLTEYLRICTLEGKIVF